MSSRGTAWRALVISWLPVCNVTAQSPATGTADAKTTITGRIVDENGAAIAGAAVGAYEWNQFVDTNRMLAEPSTVSRADGMFSLLLPRSPGSRTIVLAAEGRQSCAQNTPYGSTAEQVDLGQIVLAPAVRLIGRVRDEAGNGLADVQIRVEDSLDDRQAHWGRLLAGATTNAKGIFVVPCVPRDGLRVQATLLGYSSISRLAAQESPLDLTMQQVGLICGRVLDTAGQPVAGVPVRAIGITPTASSGHVLSATDGSFALTVPGRSRYRVSGYEAGGAGRQFRSGLLRGPQEEVEVVAMAPRRQHELLEVKVVDATTKEPIPTFRLAPVSTDPSNLQTAVFHSRSRLAAYDGMAKIERGGVDPLQAVFVEAEGHGFAVEPIPADASEGLVVELGPEAILTGRVLDSTNGQPMAGVAVRALPWGRTAGSGGNVADIGPLTGEAGRYELCGLRPGKYGVQAHADGRPASAPEEITLEAGRTNGIDLEVPKALWVETELTGTPPEGPTCTIALGAITTAGSRPGFFQHHFESTTRSAPVARHVRLGPVTPGVHHLQLRIPSRARSAAGTAIPLGRVDPEGGTKPICLPDIRMVTLRGSVDLTADIPSERIAVLAHPVRDRTSRIFFDEGRNLAGLDGSGHFAIDLPAGSYDLQLADLETGIVFHTEANSIELDDRPISLHPEFRWLEVRCTPEVAGGELELSSFRVALDQPRQGALNAFVHTTRSSRGRAQSSVPIRTEGERHRWLVPAGEISITAQRYLSALHPNGRGSGGEDVATATLDIDKPTQQLVLKITPAPPDEDLPWRK